LLPPSFPKAQGVVIGGLRITRPESGKTVKALHHLIGLPRGPVVGYGQDVVRPRVGWVQVGAMQKYLHSLVVAAVQVKGKTQPDGEPLGRGITFQPLRENLDGGVRGLMDKELAAPIEEI